MLLTLTASCLRASLLPTPKKPKPAIAMADLPHYTREVLGLSGINLSTDLLAGSSRRDLENIRERADKAGCSCLLLVEADAQPITTADAAQAEAIIARLRRVVEAAQLLGCTAAGVRLTASDTEADFATAVSRMKQVVERAERLDINVLIMPAVSAGLTLQPEKVTELLKKVGGFRIGTLPDFETASKAKDPITYLRRLTPYATVVCAATQKFTEQGAPPPPPPAAGKSKRRTTDEEDDLDLDSLQAKIAQSLKSAGKAPKTPKGAAALAADLDLGALNLAGLPPGSGAGEGGKAAGEPQLEAKPKGKKSSKKSSATPPPEPPPPPPPPPESADDDDLGELDDESLEGLIEDIMAEEASDEPPPEPLPGHPAYDLFAMVNAIASVGYDGTLSIDYRGPGDVILGLQHSRRLLKAALDQAAASA